MDGVFGICTQIHGKVQAVCVDRVRIAQNLCIFLYQFILIYIYIYVTLNTYIQDEPKIQGFLKKEKTVKNLRTNYK